MTDAERIAELERSLAAARAALRGFAVTKPFGTYNRCMGCGATWWDDEREQHNFQCRYRKALAPQEGER